MLKLSWKGAAGIVLVAGAGLWGCESKSDQPNAREEVFGEGSQGDMNARLDAYAEPVDEETPSGGESADTEDGSGPEQAADPEGTEEDESPS